MGEGVRTPHTVFPFNLVIISFLLLSAPSFISFIYSPVFYYMFLTRIQHLQYVRYSWSYLPSLYLCWSQKQQEEKHWMPNKDGSREARRGKENKEMGGQESHKKRGRTPLHSCGEVKNWEKREDGRGRGWRVPLLLIHCLICGWQWWLMENHSNWRSYPKPCHFRLPLLQGKG